MTADELRRIIQRLHDMVAAIYTENKDLRNRVLSLIKYLNTLNSLPDDQLLTRQNELYERLLEERDHMAGHELEVSQLVNEIKQLGARLRPDDS
jgi:transcription initiation factor IIE alpha subunit